VSSARTQQLTPVIDGKYALLRELGSGAAGAVYEAEHLVVGKRVAVKVLDPELGKNPALRTRFVAEARAAARIGHANVVDIHDLGVAPDGTSYMVMELLEGETLEQIILARGAIPSAYACELMLQVLAALGAAHSLGIVHRDLKPANVIVTHPRPDRPHVTVLDFGIAKGVVEAAAESSEQPVLLGTPLYMAPEQALGRDVDERTDMYSAGAMLYEMLAGRPVFEGRTTQQVLSRVLAGNWEPLGNRNPNVPRELAALVESALASDPRQRPASAEEFAERLTAFVVAPHAISQMPKRSAGPQPIPLVGAARRIDLITVSELEAEPLAGRWVSSLPFRESPGAIAASRILPLSESLLCDPRIPKAPLTPRLDSGALPLVVRKARASINRRLSTLPAVRELGRRRNLLTALLAAVAGFGIGLAVVALSGSL
jgi:eukaryotic-like serine/threonine-protein kinase